MRALALIGLLCVPAVTYARPAPVAMVRIESGDMICDFTPARARGSHKESEVLCISYTGAMVGALINRRGLVTCGMSGQYNLSTDCWSMDVCGSTMGACVGPLL
jgi:hypothetical protein